MLSSRIREEYRLALDAYVEELREDPQLARIQKYDVLEHLLRDVLTPEGRARIKAELLTEQSK